MKKKTASILLTTLVIMMMTACQLPSSGEIKNETEKAKT